MHVILPTPPTSLSGSSLKRTLGTRLLLHHLNAQLCTSYCVVWHDPCFQNVSGFRQVKKLPHNYLETLVKGCGNKRLSFPSRWDYCVPEDPEGNKWKCHVFIVVFLAILCGCSLHVPQKNETHWNPACQKHAISDTCQGEKEKARTSFKNRYLTDKPARLFTSSLFFFLIFILLLNA